MKSIVLFNSNNLLAASIVIVEDRFVVEYFDKTIEKELSSLLRVFEQKPLIFYRELQEDVDNFLIKQSLGVGDSGYEDVLVKELNSRGMNVLLVDSSIVENFKYNREEWKKMLNAQTDIILNNKAT